MSLQTILSIVEMRKLIQSWRSHGLTVGFVPTMGALHDGHLKLVREIKAQCDRVVVSIFVNPLQFGPTEDFSRYPRTLSSDLQMLSDVPADAVFAPNSIEIYPNHFQTSVINKDLANGLCGPFRPGHFEGVLTVVLKFLSIITPDVAIFGKKDYQQWRLISRMVTDLSICVKILGSETLREPDGVALSSRNRYLSTEQRKYAPLIYQGLQAAKSRFKSGNLEVEGIIAEFRKTIEACADLRVQYAELVHSENLRPVLKIEGSEDFALIVAVIYADVRLIDNIEFGGSN